MIFDHKEKQLHHLRGALSTLVAPIQYTVSWPIEVFDWVNTSIARQKALIAENANLRAQDLLLRARMQKIMSLENENSQLRSLLQSAAHINEHFTVAKLLAVSSDPYVSQVVVNQGKKQGLTQGQAVLDGSGVMGQVIDVGPLTARVMLITDVRSAVPVQVERTAMRAIAVGAGSRRELELVNVPVTADLRIGDVLTTSGLGLRYPEGYPVGVVSKIKHIPGEHFATIYLKPSAHLFQSRQVLLVWHEAQEVYQQASQDLAAIQQQHHKRGS